MTSQTFLIGPIKDGLRKDVKPFATPEDAFQSLLNAYQWRGRIVRRSGYILLGRLANNTPVMGLKTRDLFIPKSRQLVAFDTTQAYYYDFGTTSFIALPSVPNPVTWSGTDYQFFQTVNYAGAFWATNSKAGLNGYNLTLFANQAGPPYTVEVTSAGNTFGVNDRVYFLNTASNSLRQGKVTIAGNPFTVEATDGLGAFSNGASAGMVLGTTKSIAGQDGIRFYASCSVAGSSIGDTWVNYNPPVSTTTALAGCLLMFPYRGYLVFLNTTEGNDTGTNNFGNRARWTQIGTPYYSEPIPNTPSLQTADSKAVRDDLFGRGGANDAPTQEIIIGAAFIRDILVVYFEQSTWRLRFVNNSQNPFVWERVNVELGSDCTSSTIPFDKGVMAIGKRGIVISDGNDTMRFDEKIPDDIFAIRQANNGLERVCGIRTFRSRLNFWTFPSSTNPQGIYPDSVLVYNYETQNWSFFDDCFTTFGYYYPGGGGKTWAELTNPWTSYNDENASSGVTQSGFETVVAGNQQGFVFELEQGNSTNSESLYISALAGSLITSPNHNLANEAWITLSGITGTTNLDGSSLNGRNYKVANTSNAANTFTITEFAPISAGNASGASFTYSIGFLPILPGSVQINVGALEFKDISNDGDLYVAGVVSGTINYTTGALVLSFSPPIASTAVYIRVVSLSPDQGINEVKTTGAYTGGGLIAKISNIDIQTKVFNFFGVNQRARLSQIDFYTDLTKNGQFTCNVFADSGNIPVNTPLNDNPQSNVVQTTANPFQVSTGASETLYTLFCDAIAQTIQLQFEFSDAQMAVTSINSEDIEILGMMFSMRAGGRLV